MRLYRNILFASDLTPASDIVGTKAMTLAKNSNALLNIVHVMEPILSEQELSEVSSAVISHDNEKLLGIAQNRLAEQAQNLSIPTTQQWFLHGFCKEEITRLAEKINADLIVVGGHDRRGLSMLFTSISDEIFKAMPCDVLAVRFDSYLEQ